MGFGMTKLEIAIVGCGDIAGFTALVARLVPQVRLSACCDVNTDQARRFARCHRIPQVFTDYAELLAHASAEAVYLAVPHYLHYEMILAALGAGKPVFVEKPFTRTLAEGIKLVEMGPVQKIGVNYQYRYDSGCYALGRAIQAGELGHIHSIRINIPWHRTQSYFDGAAWHKTIAQAGGR
jgi:UDP-N-acetyl-2-amino-2-deoxyglucuronate dehydrogenase